MLRGKLTRWIDSLGVLIIVHNMKYLLCIMLLSVTSYAIAPTYESTGYWVTARVTCYSPLQKNERKVSHRNKSIRNENGIAVPTGTLPDGTRLWIPFEGWRVVDDRQPQRSARKLMRRYNVDITIDVRYYQSLNRNKPINRQLRKLDKGVCEVWISYDK